MSNHQEQPIHVVVINAPEDDSYRLELMQHLRIMQRSGIIDQILDTAEPSSTTLESANTATVFISLISGHFANSEWSEQLHRIGQEKSKSEKAILFPIEIDGNSIRVYEDGSPIKVSKSSKSNIVDTPTNREEGWTEATKRLSEKIKHVKAAVARERIEYASINNQKILDLGNCNLTDVPHELFELHWLEVLILGGNNAETNLQMRFISESDSTTIREIDRSFRDPVVNNASDATIDFTKLPWRTQNTGGRNDLKDADLSQLQKLKKLRVLNIEGCNINILGIDLSGLEQLSALLAANNTCQPVKNTAIRGKYKTLSILSLSQCNINVLPDDFFPSFSDTVEHLNLSLNPEFEDRNLLQLRNCNKLLSLDLDAINLAASAIMIGRPSRLQWLNLSHNRLQEIDFVNTLGELETLHFDENHVTDLAPLFGLTKLKKLSLAGNNPSSVPTSLAPLMRLVNLQYLNIKDNALIEVDVLKNLAQLRRLNIQGNRIKSIVLLRNLKNLVELGAQRNSISKISQLTACKKLETLLLDENNITDQNEIRTVVTELKGLKEISVANNPLKDFDITLLKHFRTRDAFLKHFRDLDEKRTANNEVKLILVGNSTAGKSTLRRMIQSKSFEDKEGTTHGIVKDMWKIQGQDDDETELKVNIWDFGGQEYYHETHKMFFSKNAVYLLMWEASTDKNEIKETNVQVKEDGGTLTPSKKYIEHYSLEYWLKNIRHYAPDSPILLVQNKIDTYFKAPTEASSATTRQPVQRIKRASEDILNMYNIADSFDVSLLKVKDKDPEYEYDYKKLIHVLKKNLFKIANTFHLGRGVNEIKESLIKKKGEKFLSKTDFDAYCNQVFSQSAGNAKVDLDLLINYLHDISVVLYFKERDNLKETVFLDPVWISEQIYFVLDTKVLENSGHFNEEHVNHKLGDDAAKKFIDLMKQFQIIFHNKSRNEFVAPQYLPDTSGNRYYNLVKAQFVKPRFVLEFPKFLPKTIMNSILNLFAEKAIESSYYKYGVAFSTDYDTINILEYDFNKSQISYYSKTDDQYNIREIFEAIISIFDIKLPNSLSAEPAESTHQILTKESTLVLVSIDGKSFVNWNKLFLRRSQLLPSEVLVPEKGSEINAGSLGTFYLSKDEIKERHAGKPKKDPVKVFISYSHKDELYKDELLEHLSGLKRLGVIQQWTDRAIVPGEKWDGEIKKNLEESQIIIFLVSPSFMASDYIHNYEIKAALDRHSRAGSELVIIPIPVRHCDFSSLPLKVFQSAIPDLKPISSSAWTYKDEAWAKVVESVKEVIQKRFPR